MTIKIKEENQLLKFGFENAFSTGRIVRLNLQMFEALNKYKNIHSDLIKVILDTLSLTSLVSYNFKIQGNFKLQLQSNDGIIKTLVCDCNLQGEIRVYADFHKSKLDSCSNEKKLSFSEIVGEDSYLSFIADYGLKNSYSDMVSLSGNSLQECANNWYAISEQIKTEIVLISDIQNYTTVGLFVQLLPNEYANKQELESNINIFETIVSHTKTLTNEEANSLSFEDILYRLYHEYNPIKYDYFPIVYKCICSKDYILDKIKALPNSEKDYIFELDPEVSIKCNFCDKEYKVSKSDVS